MGPSWGTPADGRKHRKLVKKDDLRSRIPKERQPYEDDGGWEMLACEESAHLLVALMEDERLSWALQSFLQSFDGLSSTKTSSSLHLFTVTLFLFPCSKLNWTSYSIRTKNGLCCKDQMSTAHIFQLTSFLFQTLLIHRITKIAFHRFCIFFFFFRYLKQLNNAWFTFVSTLGIGGRQSRSRLSLVWRWLR